jgi:hypothetical protein
MLSAILIGTLVVVAGSLFAWRRHGQQRGRARDDSEPPSRELPSTRSIPRHDTALDELRAMREALKPAEHSRVERRRPGGSGSPPAPERRRGRGPGASTRATSGAPPNDGASREPRG